MIRATIAGGGVLPHIHKVRPFPLAVVGFFGDASAGEGSDAELSCFDCRLSSPRVSSHPRRLGLLRPCRSSFRLGCLL
jgi:hypothetical protein